MEIFYVRLRAQPPPSRDFPRQEGGNRMGRHEKGRSPYEWATLIVKLLTALAALIATFAELLR